ncbi:P-selectin-like [Ruditapes philippinarum]|uniref:P-selectin-like n=1 Tax=Ruditapes philippinarum TaxID=129788 RepID=UPI00295AD33D|nr:P-selectin-like [Ruditapes philippinarum]
MCRYPSCRVSYRCPALPVFPRPHQFATCQANGIWDNNDPADCFIGGCPRLTLPTNGQMSEAQCGDWTSGCVVTFTCDEGYTLDGPNQMTCQHNSTWSPTNNPPECKIRKSKIYTLNKDFKI